MNVSSSGEHAVFVCSAAVLRAAPLQPLQTIQTDNNMWLTVNTETSLLLFTLITSRCIRQSDQRGWSLPLRFAVSVILEDLFHHVEISPSPPLSLSLSGLPLRLYWKNSSSLVAPLGSLKRMGWEHCVKPILGDWLSTVVHCWGFLAKLLLAAPERGACEEPRHKPTHVVPAASSSKSFI